MAGEDTCGYYNIPVNGPRGYLVIVNNETFRTMKTRSGSSKDADDLKNVFEELFHFEVIRRDNLTKEEIMYLMRKVAREIHTEIGCLIIALLSHGLEGAIYSSDEDFVYISDVVDCFKINSCPALAGKPKVIMVQACQNENPELTCTSQEADFFVVYSTLPRASAMRHEEDGSWFIQELVHVLQEQDNIDMYTIMKIVTSKLASKGQTPICMCTLQRKLYLLPPSITCSKSLKRDPCQDFESEGAALVYPVLDTCTRYRCGLLRYCPSENVLHLPTVPSTSVNNLQPFTTNENISEGSSSKNSNINLSVPSVHNEEQLLNECDKEGEQFMLEDEGFLKTSHEKVNVASMKPENPSQMEVTNVTDREEDLCVTPSSIPSKYWKMSLYEPKHVSRALSSRSLPSHLSSSGLAKKIPMELNKSNSGSSSENLSTHEKQFPDDCDEHSDMSKDEELEKEGEVDETEWEFVEQENEQQACLQPLTTESNKTNSEGIPVQEQEPLTTFSINLPVLSLQYEEQLLHEFDKEEQESSSKRTCERENIASAKITCLDPNMEVKEAKSTLRLTPPISIISPLTSGVSSLPYVSPPLSGMLCTEDEDAYEDWVILDHEEWVLLESKDWEGEIDETEWVIVDKINRE